MDDFASASLAGAARRISTFAADPGTGIRCRRFAEARFALPVGVAAYYGLYAELGSSPGP